MNPIQIHQEHGYKLFPVHVSSSDIRSQYLLELSLTIK